jgi:serine/threonine protein kinase
LWSLRFDKTIGAGAFGTVYLAELKSDRGLKRPVAVKMIQQGHADSEMFVTRMRDEARLLRMLRDKNVLHVLDLINIEGRDAIIMEYVNGADMDAVLSRYGPLPARAVVEIGATIAATLDRAHRAVHPVEGTPLGVVHRDVKPANIMMTSSGHLRLLDFGVAQARFAARESTTGQLVLGTLNYMAPDYIVTGEVKPALDVYGLALTLWELAIGEVYGQPKMRQDSHEKRLQSRMGELQANHAPLIPELQQMMSWRPEDRPTTREVARRLQALMPTIGGTTLAEVAATIIPTILADQPVTEDAERLLGRQFRIELPPSPQDQDPDLPTEKNLPPAPQPAADSASSTGIADASALESEEATDIAPPEVLTRHLCDSNSVTIGTAHSPRVASPPRRSSSKAILGGVVIGGLVGLLAVAGLAILLFG